jgi:predicted ATPase
MKFKVKTSEVTEEINEFTFCLPTSEKTIIIEEPEANLHPNLQSKLADVFVEIIKYYPEINFIIETHSEYMIRRLQYLTAKREICTDKSIIYYFNAEKYVRPNEPKVKAIQITSNGNLTDTFGPGFYDESTRLQFDLMKLNQEQKN